MRWVTFVLTQPSKIQDVLGQDFLLAEAFCLMSSQVSSEKQRVQHEGGEALKNQCEAHACKLRTHFCPRHCKHCQPDALSVHLTPHTRSSVEDEYHHLFRCNNRILSQYRWAVEHSFRVRKAMGSPVFGGCFET